MLDRISHRLCHSDGVLYLVFYNGDDVERDTILFAHLLEIGRHRSPRESLNLYDGEYPIPHDPVLVVEEDNDGERVLGTSSKLHSSIRMSRKYNVYARGPSQELRRLELATLGMHKSRVANSSDAEGGSGDLIADQTLQNNIPAINPGELPTEITFQKQGLTVNHTTLAQLQATHQNQTRSFTFATSKDGGNGNLGNVEFSAETLLVINNMIKSPTKIFKGTDTENGIGLINYMDHIDNSIPPTIGQVTKW